MNIITPFKRLTKKEQNYSIIILVTIIFLIWIFSGNKFLPSPIEIVKSLPRLVMDKDLFDNFFLSIFFCFKCMFYSFCISIVICYMSVIPLFKTMCSFLRKFRFLPSAGLSFFFLKLSNGDQNWQMTNLMVFGVTTWMIDGMVGVALSISQDEVNYCKSLRLNRWQMMRELLIIGKIAELFTVCISVFAISWMMISSIENIAKANGGIGVVLAESNKYLKFEEVYAIQILILFTGISIDWILNVIKGFFLPYTKI